MKLSQIIKNALNKQASQVAIPVAKYVEMMVINRCINPSSKLGVIRWLEGTCYKEMDSYSDLNLYSARSQSVIFKSLLPCNSGEKLRYKIPIYGLGEYIS